MRLRLRSFYVTNLDYSFLLLMEYYVLYNKIVCAIYEYYIIFVVEYYCKY